MLALLGVPVAPHFLVFCQELSEKVNCARMEVAFFMGGQGNFNGIVVDEKAFRSGWTFAQTSSESIILLSPVTRRSSWAFEILALC